MGNNSTVYDKQLTNDVLATLLNDSFDGIVVIDSNGVVMMVNPKAREIFNIADNGDSSSSSYAELFMMDDIPENDEFHQQVLDAIASPNVNLQGDRKYVCNDGRAIHLHVSTSFMQQDDGTGFLMLHLTDITEIVQAREMAEKALEVKSLFMQNMTHEIRTPLNAINGFSQIMSAPGMISSEDELSEYSELIKENTEALTTLLNDILFICDIDCNDVKVRMEPVDCNDLCASITAQLAGTKDEVELKFKPSEEELMVVSDKNLLGTALTKVVHNALKFTNEGQVVVECSSKGAAKIISVMDSGCGIPESEQANIFKRFYKIDEFILGAGLGLSVCYEIMRLLGWTINIDNSYKHGVKVDLIYNAKQL